MLKPPAISRQRIKNYQVPRKTVSPRNA
jgi:hypothetical protein